MNVVRVPASTANLGPGFDALGMALGLHFELGFASDGVEVPPLEETHLAVRAFRRLGGTGALWARSPIPAGRGLGFSGAARVAGLVAAVVQRQGTTAPLAEAYGEILAVADELEGHADNVAASLYGGVVATAGGRAVPVPLAFDPVVVVWVPSFETSTDESRGRLRATVSRADAVFNVGRTALLVAALAAGDVAALRCATEDRLHQDARFAAAPAARVALEHALSAGAWCGWLSGSGPSVASLCSTERADAVAAALPPGGDALLLRIDHAGAVVEAASGAP
jgi:homoserine kinase